MPVVRITYTDNFDTSYRPNLEALSISKSSQPFKVDLINCLLCINHGSPHICMPKRFLNQLKGNLLIIHYLPSSVS